MNSANDLPVTDLTIDDVRRTMRKRSARRYWIEELLGVAYWLEGVSESDLADCLRLLIKIRLDDYRAQPRKFSGPRIIQARNLLRRESIR